MERRYRSPFDLLEIAAFRHRIVETFLLRAGGTHLCKDIVDRLLVVLLRPDGGPVGEIVLGIWVIDVHHAQVDDVPVPDRVLPTG